MKEASWAGSEANASGHGAYRSDSILRLDLDTRGASPHRGVEPLAIVKQEGTVSDDRFFNFEAETYSSGMQGRALQRVRENNFVIDDANRDPYYGPGEAPNAGEYFLSGITGCAVLMMERIARTEDVPLEKVHVRMEAGLDTQAERGEHTLLDTAHMHFNFTGTSKEQAERLVDIFKAK
jgi:uncharacterized OsmC-like protein